MRLNFISIGSRVRVCAKEMQWRYCVDNALMCKYAFTMSEMDGQTGDSGWRKASDIPQKTWVKKQKEFIQGLAVRECETDLSSSGFIYWLENKHSTFNKVENHMSAEEEGTDASQCTSNYAQSNASVLDGITGTRCHLNTPLT